MCILSMMEVTEGEAKSLSQSPTLGKTATVQGSQEDRTIVFGRAHCCLAIFAARIQSDEREKFSGV